MTKNQRRSAKRRTNPRVKNRKKVKNPKRPKRSKVKKTAKRRRKRRRSRVQVVTAAIPMNLLLVKRFGWKRMTMIDSKNPTQSNPSNRRRTMTKMRQTTNHKWALQYGIHLDYHSRILDMLCCPEKVQPW